MSLYSIVEQGKERLWSPITFPLPADTENEILFDVAEQIKREIWDDIEAAFPEFRLPVALQPSRETRLNFYTNGRIDALGMKQGGTEAVDYPFLRDRQYLKKLKDGLYPPLVSPFWADLVDLPPVFRFVQADFLRLTNFIADADEPERDTEA